MFRQFKFEEEVARGNGYIPLAARYKMDLIGIHLTLKSWNRFREEERGVLCHLSVRSQGEKECYKNFTLYLLARIGERADFLDPAELRVEREHWENPIVIPALVQRKIKEAGLGLTEENWLRMDDLERYALYKMARDKFPSGAFDLAIQEFGTRSKLHGSMKRVS